MTIFYRLGDPGLADSDASRRAAARRPAGRPACAAAGRQVAARPAKAYAFAGPACRALVLINCWSTLGSARVLVSPMLASSVSPALIFRSLAVVCGKGAWCVFL